jgi:diguanylate cyclase (GGDEF)-like protein
VALGFCLVLTAWTAEARGLVIAVYMVTMLFGIFALARRDFLLIAALAFVGYATLVAGEHWLMPGRLSLEWQLVSLLVLACLLGWTAFFGAYVSNLRYRLRHRNDELEQALGRIQELAERDDLTGLFNRRYVTEALQQLKSRADRRTESFSLCIVDLDDFKSVNDRYGHAAGDRVLVEFARSARATLRDMDLIGVSEREDTTVGRFGGEEFILVLPATGLEGAWQCAERLRAMQENMAEQQPGLAVTLSAGVAEYVRGESIENLLRRADRALYAAKAAGRNRVVTADELLREQQPQG